MKRYLSLLLIFVMVMSFVPSAWANCSHPESNWTQRQEVTPATCTAPAVYGYICGYKATEDGTSCGMINTRSEGTPLGHDWNPATCTSPRTCSRCGATEGYALGHDWRAATCTAPKTCTRCGQSDGAALGHDCSIFIKIVESATTEKNAKGLYKCSRCDEGQDLREIPGTKLELPSINPPYSGTEPVNTDYTLTLIADPVTKGTVEGSGTYAYGSIAKAIATPNKGYKFTGWTDQVGNPIDNKTDRVLDIPMYSDLTYVAHFIEEKSSPVTPTGSYQVTGITNPAGIAVLGGLGSHAAGTFVTLTANQSMDTGYIFSHWNLIGVNDYNSLANPCIFVMPEGNVAATAVYTPVQAEFTITYSPGSNAKEISTYTQKKYRDIPVSLYMNQYTRDGYVQTGWTTDPNRNVIEYALGTQYYANANLVLYPTWGIPGQHYLTVTFNENGKDKVHTGSAVVISGTVYPLKDDGSATFKFDTVGEIYPYNVKLNGVSKGSLNEIVVSGQAYDQTLEIEFESIYTKPKTGDDSAVFLWTVLGLSALVCGAVSFAYVRKKREE